jgi:hypothetical protein
MRSVADDGTGWWEWDSDYGYFDITKLPMPSSTTTQGHQGTSEEQRIRDHGAGSGPNPEYKAPGMRPATLEFVYGEGIVVRMYTGQGPGTKTIGGKTISTRATDNYYMLYAATTGCTVGEALTMNQPNTDQVAGQKIDEKLQRIYSATDTCYQTYDLGGGKIGVQGTVYTNHNGVTNQVYGQVYVYLLAEAFEGGSWAAYERQQGIADGSITKGVVGPVDYPDKYYTHGEVTAGLATNSGISNNNGRNRIIAKFAITVKPANVNLFWAEVTDQPYDRTGGGLFVFNPVHNAPYYQWVNFAGNNKTIRVGESFTLGIHGQIKSTFGFDAEGWNRFQQFEFTNNNPDIIEFAGIEPRNPDTHNRVGNPKPDPVVSGSVTALKAGTATIKVRLYKDIVNEHPCGPGLYEDTESIFIITVTN